MANVSFRGLDQFAGPLDVQKSHTAGAGNLTGTVVDRVYTIDEAGERC